MKKKYINYDRKSSSLFASYLIANGLVLEDDVVLEFTYSVNDSVSINYSFEGINRLIYTSSKPSINEIYYEYIYPCHKSKYQLNYISDYFSNYTKECFSTLDRENSFNIGICTSFDDEYHLTPEEEEELISTDDYDFGAEGNPTNTEESNIPEYEKVGMDYEVSILTPVNVAFAKYMLEGVRNIGRIMYGRIDDIERLSRRRNISNADKLNQIRHLCAQNKENYELLCRCADDVEGTVCEKIPDDFWEFYEDYEREGKHDGE